MKYRIIFYFITCCLSTISVIYIQQKILKTNIKCSLKEFILSSFILILLGIVNILFVNKFLRFIFITFAIMFYSMIIFKKNFSYAIIATLVQQIILFLSEIIIVAIFTFLDFNPFQLAIDSNYIYLIFNLLIMIIAFIISNISIVNNIFDRIRNYFYGIFSYKKYLLLFIFLFTLNVLLMTIYLSNNFLVLIINIFFISIYSIIFYFFLKEKNKNYLYENENKNLIKTLNEYENVLEHNKINNHENKNQFIVIKSMVENKDSKIIEYLNEIINEKDDNNEIILNLSNSIPNGGLKGLIYQKMLVAKKYGIKVVLNINRNITQKCFDNILTKTKYDLFRIIGVFIDNAIEETKQIEKKEILISMYMDNNIIFEISNYYDNNIELDKIYEKGYSSKSKKHGYGLCLVRKIFNSNNNIMNEVEFINNIFIQRIIIKI